MKNATMKNVTYTPEELNFFGLSPKDNYADYTPSEYFAVVNGSLAAGKMNDYTLAEIQEVENNLRQVYSTLSTPQMSTEQIVASLDGPNETLINIVNLRQNKEKEQKKVITSALAFLNEVVDEYDADAPENLARKYIGDVRNDLAAGKLDQYSLAQLQEVENKFKEAYSVLSEEEKEIQSESCVQTIIDLTDLQNNNIEFIVPSLIEDYFTDSKKNPQSWEGFNPGKYKLSNKQSNAVKPYSEQLKDTVEYSLADLIAVDSQRDNPENNESSTQIFSLKNNSAVEEEYSLSALLGKAMISPTAQASFKAYCVVQPKRANKKVSEESAESTSLFSSSNIYSDASRGIVEMYDLFARLEELSQLSVSQLPVAANTPVATVPMLVAIQPSKPKSNFKPKSANTIANALAKAAIVAAAGIASLIGYNSLSVNAVDDHQLDYYQGSPSVEVVAPVKAKSPEKMPELKVVKTMNKSVEQPAVVPQSTSPAPRAQKWSGKVGPNAYTVEKGDTVYHSLCAGDVDCVKEIQQRNPGVNLNTLVPGQKLNLDQNKKVKKLSTDLDELNCDTMRDLHGGIYPFDQPNAGEKHASELSRDLDYLGCKTMVKLKQ